MDKVENRLRSYRSLRILRHYTKARVDIKELVIAFVNAKPSEGFSRKTLASAGRVPFCGHASNDPF
jgi:hypothetical protein